ncbi:hypothetical protein KPH14_006854 [Odynerus spinipes]|uniref:Uncharacterized protein n=1 Tax=Odynerus spinipes TaxID=1348599 RepID=A0AAD9VRV0_9HYME|nr:hypothetical protein KPH14_006854 [Odynerus spinipes]
MQLPSVHDHKFQSDLNEYRCQPAEVATKVERTVPLGKHRYLDVSNDSLHDNNGLQLRSSSVKNRVIFGNRPRLLHYYSRLVLI